MLAPTDFKNAGQVILVNCAHSVLDNMNAPIYGYYSNNLTIIENQILNTQTGIHLQACNQSKIFDNTIKSITWYGIYLRSTNFTEIHRNLVSNCVIDGIFLSNNDNDNSLINNTISNNSRGLEISSVSNNNTIILNYFFNNDYHASDGGNNNEWNSSAYGNYWDDYTGNDDNGDGIGEDPYNISISGIIQDHYPLWENQEPAVCFEFPLNDTYNSNLDINITAIDKTDWKLEPVAAIDTVLAELDNTKNITLTQITNNLWSKQSYEFTEGQCYRQHSTPLGPCTRKYHHRRGNAPPYKP